MRAGGGDGTIAALETEILCLSVGDGLPHGVLGQDDDIGALRRELDIDERPYPVFQPCVLLEWRKTRGRLSVAARPGGPADLPPPDVLPGVEDVYGAPVRGTDCPTALLEPAGQGCGASLPHGFHGIFLVANSAIGMSIRWVDSKITRHGVPH